MLSKAYLSVQKRLSSSELARNFSTFERNVHIIGYPFAGGQPRSGPEMSAVWLSEQKWIREREGVTFEMVQVTSRKNNSEEEEPKLHGQRLKNLQNVLQSSKRLEDATEKALRNNLFPIVFGGDHSQGIGSVNGCKNVYPNARVLWIDAHVDANTDLSSPSGNIHGCPVSFLTGLTPYYKKPVLSFKHLIYFGLRQWEPEEKKMLEDKDILWFKSEDCLIERMDQIKRKVENHMFQGSEREPYWISFDIDSIDQAEFKSTGTPESQGITTQFMLKFFQTFLPESVGMDFTEVNFLLTEGAQTDKDKEAVKIILDTITETVHKKKIAYQNATINPIESEIFDEKVQKRLYQA